MMKKNNLISFQKMCKNVILDSGCIIQVPIKIVIIIQILPKIALFLI